MNWVKRAWDTAGRQVFKMVVTVVLLGALRKGTDRIVEKAPTEAAETIREVGSTVSTTVAESVSTGLTEAVDEIVRKTGGGV